jgi:Zn-dependent protease with chaperone function
MKGRTKAAIYLFLLAQLGASVWELVASRLALGDEQRLRYPAGSFMDELSRDDPGYLKSQRTALNREARRYQKEAQYILFCIGLATMVLRKRIRKTILRFYSTKTSIPSAETLLIASFIFSFLLVQHFIYRKSFFIYRFSLLQTNSGVYVVEIMLLSSLLSVYLMRKALQIFGSGLIFAVYISLVIQKLYNSLSIRGVNEGKYRKVSAEAFPEEIQRLLFMEGLADSVYISRDGKDMVNAALVGLGRKRRIEIRGDTDMLEEREVNAIVLHEIGHAIDMSLLKRKIADNTVLVGEMLILAFLYSRSPGLLGCSYLSKEGSFILLGLLYHLSARVWVLMVPRMVSQCNELSADAVAKSYGYGRSLASALYKLCVSNSVLISPFFLTNAINSLHPSVHLRIQNAI